MKTTRRQTSWPALLGVLAFTTTAAVQRFLQQFGHSIIPGIPSESPASIMRDKHNV